MRKGFIALLGAATMFSGSATAQNCTVPPTCENLGYVKTAADCDGLDTLKCPFDLDKLFCGKGLDAEAPGESIPPVPGAILYSDGTISNNVIADKTPVGIVAYVNGSNGFAVALTESNQTWATGNENVSCVTEYSSSSTVQKDMYGKNNTVCLVNYNSGYRYPAAEYCNKFSAASTGTGSGGWYLPAAGELYAMSSNYEAINLGLRKLAETQISSSYYWSSSESSYDFGYHFYAWLVRPSDGSMSGNYFKSQSEWVRCVLSF